MQPVKKRTARLKTLRGNVLPGFSLSLFSNQAVIRLPRVRMPATDRKDSWRPTSITALGFWRSRRSSAKESAVGVSPSLPSAGPSRSSICNTPARTTDGGKPVSAIKASTTGMHTRARRRRFLPVRAVNSSTSIPTCIPETATTWAIPQRLSAE